ncbi:hypothetical protein C8A01DRAFT_44710 [Parachaetomium inaequale]|uniref:Chromo domain-containing protein n=1 Tax=Parachaetomium inaequale TaxID=2588326 RepID=A0AAN6PLN9_9PEZI|nr:hypothetical protein C8A01DRAFT_44710 [Parachaetomium inaequale]
MFKVNPRASFGALSPDGDESDDNISVTSTVSGHNSDQEFGVEGILAEHRFEDGNTYYLVEWTGFQLHESTWEPESNLGADLKAMWEEDKAKHATGELEPFDVQKFEDARSQAKRDKKARHRRRNQKRRKLGLPLTAPFDNPKDSSDEEEAVEEAGIEAPVPEPAQAARPQNQPKVFKGVPGSQPVTPVTVPVAASFRPSNEARRSATGVQRQQTEPSSATGTKRRQTAPAQATLYPGTARKPSKTSTDTMPKSKTRLALSIPTTTTPRPMSAARKPLTAKKSTTQPTGNIFTGGKTRKPRASLKDAMSDPTKDPKLFAKFRQRRLAELGSRRKEDIAPDLANMQLFDLRSGQTVSGQAVSGQTVSRRSSAASILSPTQVLSPQQEIPSPFEPAQAHADAARPKKKRKSVRFFVQDDEDDPVLVQEPEQMDVDSPITQEHPQASLRPSARQRPSLDTNRLAPPVQSNQTSDKKLVLGQGQVEATFNGLPRDPSGQRGWLSDFVAKKTLKITHTCLANTAAVQIGPLIQERLASGTITSNDGEPALARVAVNLTAGLLALYYGQAEYNVLIYPTKCEEWKSALPGLVPASPSEVVLGYLIFSSPENCRLMLPPLAPPSESQPEPEESTPNTESRGGASARDLLVKRLFGFDYDQLLPAMLLRRPLQEHAFFLAIPNSRREIGLALYHWLRARNPECQIFTSHQAGGWDTFRSRVETIPGVVIIHELLAWSLRRFPNLSRYLVTRNDEYWCISEPVHGPPMYPSISVPEYPVPPGDMSLARLFPYRTAIFLTPSFLVSEPRRSLEFFKWFTNQWVGKFFYRLVTAYNIHEYLAELAEERYQARQELLNSPGDVQFDIEASLNGLSRDDCSCRYAVASLAADMHVSRIAQAGPLAQDEDNSTLVYADSSIDPNDEQSLINWFGWWATLRADQFRKFHVIGSSQSIKLHGCRRGERRIRIPKYSKVTLDDPDAVLEVLQERNDQVEAAEAGTNGNDMAVQSSTGGENERGFNKGRWAFRSNLLRFEDSSCFAAYLDSLNVLNGCKSQWLLYRFPVSWVDLGMAEYFNDFAAKYPRIPDWFKFTYPFGACYSGDGPARPPFGYNTYVGFFYTIDDEWDPPDSDSEQPKKPLERHPWIGIYRPVNPHRKPYGRCELIIWDPAARTRYPRGKAPAEKDLIPMQRQLIQHVRDHGDEKNHGTWLDQTKGWRRVVLGVPHSSFSSPGRDTPSNADSSSLFVDQHPADDDGDVLMGIDSPSVGGRGGNPEDEEDDEEEDENTRIIFHPPRGHNNNHNNHQNHQNRSRGDGVFSRSKCVNRLYEEARLARARGGGSGSGTAAHHMRYGFVPTMDWYREQQGEGRGFAHVNVDSWEGVFGVLKVGGGERERRGHGSGHGDGSSANGSSVNGERSWSGSVDETGRESVGSG